jgi:hypothetical protein
MPESDAELSCWLPLTKRPAKYIKMPMAIIIKMVAATNPKTAPADLRILLFVFINLLPSVE